MLISGLKGLRVLLQIAELSNFYLILVICLSFPSYQTPLPPVNKVSIVHY